jgi:hypothetical protein
VHWECAVVPCYCFVFSMEYLALMIRDWKTLPQQYGVIFLGGKGVIWILVSSSTFAFNIINYYLSSFHLLF